MHQVLIGISCLMIGLYLLFNPVLDCYYWVIDLSVYHLNLACGLLIEGIGLYVMTKMR